MGRKHFPLRAVLFLAVLAQAATAWAQVVESVEPPSWWVERDSQRLLLLIEGSGLDGAQVRVVHGPIKVERIEPIHQGHALFVDITVPGNAEPSVCEIEIAADGKTFRRPWALVAKPARQPEPFGPDDVLYQILIDRFANGDLTNDELATGDKMADRRNSHAYHGGDFAGVRSRLGNLVDLGVTAIWLTPVYHQSPTWFQGVVAGRREEWLTSTATARLIFSTRTLASAHWTTFADLLTKPIDLGSR